MEILLRELERAKKRLPDSLHQYNMLLKQYELLKDKEKNHSTGWKKVSGQRISTSVLDRLDNVKSNQLLSRS
jgi:hypothetical protein